MTREQNGIVTLLVIIGGSMSVCHCATCAHYRRVMGVHTCDAGTHIHLGMDHAKPAIVLNCSNYKEKGK